MLGAIFTINLNNFDDFTLFFLHLIMLNTEIVTVDILSVQDKFKVLTFIYSSKNISLILTIGLYMISL